MVCVHWLSIRDARVMEIEVRIVIGSGCLLDPAFGRVGRLNYIRLGGFFHGVHFVSERLHSLQHGRLKHPHLLLKLDVKLSTQGFF